MKDNHDRENSWKYVEFEDDHEFQVGASPTKNIAFVNGFNENSRISDTVYGDHGELRIPLIVHTAEIKSYNFKDLFKASGYMVMSTLLKISLELTMKTR